MEDCAASSKLLAEAAPLMCMMAGMHGDRDLAVEAVFLEEMALKVRDAKARAHSRKSMRYTGANMQRGRRLKQDGGR